MYTCVKALLRQRGDNQRLTEAQVGDAAVRTLMAENSTVYLVLTHPAITGQVGLDLDTIEDAIYRIADGITVDQWLHANGDETLPTTTPLMKKEAAACGYNDLFAAGYKIQLQHPTAGEGTQLPDSELTDILVTKSGFDYKMLFDYGLATVNGLLHLTDYSTRGWKIKEGGRSTQFAKRHDLGLISFKNVGKLTCIPIKPEMVLPYAGQPMKNGFVIKVPNVDLSNKVVMMSVGGYLHFANECYNVIGDRSIKFDWWKYPLEHRYYNSNKLINMKAFTDTMVQNEDHGDALDLNQANSDVSIKAYMSLPQSFIILLDAKNFYYERHVLERTGLPGRYYSYELPKFPLQLENGLLPAYVAMPESGMYSLAIHENLIRSFQHDTKKPADDMYFNGARKSSTLGHYASAYLLEMGTEYLTQPSA
ncbi:hypothetical protein D3C85_90990 [compost metagenome]